MKRVVAWVVLILGVIGVGTALADRKLTAYYATRAPFRVYVGATPQQFDTLAVSSGERVELDNFTFYGDDSAANTPTMHLVFMSLNSRTVYARVTDSYTAGQIKSTNFAGPFVFPKDTTVLIYWNLVGANTTLDTARVIYNYRLERP